MNPQQQALSAVRFVESTDFTDFSQKNFTPLQDRGLKLILADNPLAGSPIRGNQGLQTMAYESCTIIYGVSPDLKTIYLLQALKTSGQTPPTPPPNKTVSDLLKMLAKGGIFASGKKLMDYFIDLF
jgi:hypothetical protein